MDLLIPPVHYCFGLFATTYSSYMRVQGHGISADLLKYKWAVSAIRLILSSSALFYHPHNTFYFITSICTVDLLMPNFRAAPRTVALFSIM